MNIFVFAIDGASPDLVDRWINNGYLPNLKKLKTQGISGNLKSTFPPLTGPAWSSFQTGVNPGKHGVFNWLDLQDSYEGTVVNSTSIMTKTVWEFISVRGGEIGLLSLPLTYPPQKVNGFIVPGFLTPKKTDQRTYPKELADKLEKSVPDFSSYIDEYMGGSEEAWVGYLKDIVRTRGKAGRYLIKNNLLRSKAGNGDSLFLVHFFSTDLVQHFLWDRADENWDPRLDVFKAVDKEIGKMMEISPEKSSFMVVSDHGFGPVDKIFNVNNWLKKEGYLKLKNNPRARVKRALSRLGINQHRLKPLGEKIYPAVKKMGLAPGNTISAASHPALKAFFLSDRDVDWPETLAYSKSDIGHVRLNLTGREKEGCVEADRVKSIKNEIKARLEKVSIPGTDKKLAKWVKRKEDIYYGPYTDKAPDLLFNPLSRKTLGFGAAMFLSEEVFVESFKPGNHRRNGIFFASGPTVERGNRDASIIDIAPTLLNLFSYPVPEQMDGKVIREVAPEEPTYHKPKDFYRSRSIDAQFGDPRKKLENLGYL